MCLRSSLLGEPNRAEVKATMTRGSVILLTLPQRVLLRVTATARPVQAWQTVMNSPPHVQNLASFKTKVGGVGCEGGTVSPNSFEDSCLSEVSDFVISRKIAQPFQAAMVQMANSPIAMVVIMSFCGSGERSEPC